MKIRFCVFGVLFALGLSACHGPQKLAPVASIPESYKSEAEIPQEATSPTPASSSVIFSSASSCQPGSWREVTHKAFISPERWTFEVHWGVVSAGTAVLALEREESIRRRPAYKISMDIRSDGMAGQMYPYIDHTETWLDRNSLLTVLSHKSVREKHYQMDESAVLDPTCQRLEYIEKRLDKNTVKRQTLHLSSGTLDVYGALYYLRTLPLAPDYSLDFPLYTGDKVIPVKATVRRKESVHAGGRKWSCFVVEIQAQDAAAARKVKKSEWWISDDPQRTPVRIRMEIALGHIVAELQ